MRVARFRVSGRLDMASAVQQGKVEIEETAGVALFNVRPLRRKRRYTMTLADVARMVVAHVVRFELREEKAAKRAMRVTRRRR